MYFVSEKKEQRRKKNVPRGLRRNTFRAPAATTVSMLIRHVGVVMMVVVIAYVGSSSMVVIVVVAFIVVGGRGYLRLSLVVVDSWCTHSR